MRETSKSENTKLFIEAEKLRQSIHRDLHRKIRNTERREGKETKPKVVAEEVA